MNDPFDDIVTLLRPKAVFSKPITGRGEWGVRYPAYGAPGFAIVLSGQCWLAVEEAPGPVLLAAGDFVLLPAAPAFAMFSRPGAACLPGTPRREAVHHGDPTGEPDLRILGGAFAIDPANARLLLALLPGMIHIPAGATSVAGIVGLIMDECRADRPGRETVLARLLEVMLVEALRWPGAAPGAVPAGLLAGMRDPALADVLRAMHADVAGGWTVAGLAARAGMSRSAFSARFSDVVGCAPMEYLGRWRMTLAQDALSRGPISLDRLAEDIGYESASAFSTAFRRRLGCSPGAFARARQTTVVSQPHP